MRDRLPALTILVAFFAVALPGQTAIALVGGTIYAGPADRPTLNGIVMIRDGKIAAVGNNKSVRIPPGINTINCSGLTILPGFWNSHVHFLERKWANASAIPASELTRELQEMLTQYGFTSVFDTWSPWENTRRLRGRIESGEIPGPRIRTTGEALAPRGGLPPELVPDILGFVRYQNDVPEIASAAEATAAAKKLLDRGVDGIKVYAQTFSAPIASMSESAIQAAAAEAHSRGKLAFSHPTSREGLLASVRGGVDVLVHTTPQSGPWDKTVLTTMWEKHVALIPTLKLWKYELRHDRASAQDQFVRTGVGQLRAWVAMGGTVLFGTDVGYMGDYDPADEYSFMSEAGMSLSQILASLTTTPAERFEKPLQSGRIALGMPADLVILRSDPSKNIRALADVAYTIRAGRVIYQTGK